MPFCAIGLVPDKQPVLARLLRSVIFVRRPPLPCPIHVAVCQTCLSRRQRLHAGGSSFYRRLERTFRSRNAISKDESQKLEADKRFSRRKALTKGWWLHGAPCPLLHNLDCGARRACFCICGLADGAVMYHCYRLLYVHCSYCSKPSGLSRLPVATAASFTCRQVATTSTCGPPGRRAPTGFAGFNTASRGTMACQDPRVYKTADHDCSLHFWQTQDLGVL